MPSMSQLVEEIVDAEFEVQTYVADEPKRPIAGAPATSAQLAKLEAWLAHKGLPFPPSYREFLSAANGIVGFMSGFSLLDAESVMRPPRDSHLRHFPTLARFIVSESKSLEFLAFDADAGSGDELEMVFMADNGEEGRYDSFRAFLAEQLDQLRDEIKQERADRAKLKKKKK